MIILSLVFYVIFFSIQLSIMRTLISYLNFIFLFLRYMYPSLELINYMSSVGDACLADCATTHTILRDKKYFSNFTLAQSNVHTISGPVNLIKGSGNATIILMKGTKLQIEDALYSNKSSKNLLSFKDIRRNGYHIETMNHDANEYLLITSIISGKKCILEQLPSLSCGLYQTTIRSIESYVVMNQKFNDSNAFLLWHEQLGHPGISMRRRIVQILMSIHYQADKF